MRCIATYTDMRIGWVKDKAVAEDIVQETFLRAWKSLDSLKDEKAAKSWLITILRARKRKAI